MDHFQLTLNTNYSPSGPSHENANHITTPSSPEPQFSPSGRKKARKKKKTVTNSPEGNGDNYGSVSSNNTSTKHGHRGRVIIFNNVKFNGDPLGDRLGSDIDKEALEKTLRKCNMDVDSHDNKTVLEILGILEDSLQRQEYRSASFIWCFFLSHGVSGSIFGVDLTQLPINEIVAVFWESGMAPWDA
ncbi:caspase-8-like [Paramacrobiotus metropolitanus]|uniref:caspase-8-like n=1 Tax=Paramacrobiotus metropolitanus TaxID=2943436 RepID=UPI0024457548|nr:caspase-8-like [Paramacrobiotus metropolitanus]